MSQTNVVGSQILFYVDSSPWASGMDGANGGKKDRKVTLSEFQAFMAKTNPDLKNITLEQAAAWVQFGCVVDPGVYNSMYKLLISSSTDKSSVAYKEALDLFKSTFADKISFILLHPSPQIKKIIDANPDVGLLITLAFNSDPNSPPTDPELLALLKDTVRLEQACSSFKPLLQTLLDVPRDGWVKSGFQDFLFKDMFGLPEVQLAVATALRYVDKNLQTWSTFTGDNQTVYEQASAIVQGTQSRFMKEADDWNGAIRQVLDSFISALRQVS